MLARTRFAIRIIQPIALAAILSASTGAAQPPETQSPTAAIFADVSAEVGLDFVHYNANEGELDLPEITGPGGALFDADGDGDLDLYLVQGAKLRPASAPRAGDRLYRNLLVESGELSLRDVTAESGLVAIGYGMGTAAGDIDNDGDVDLYVLNFGPNQLWRNEGDRRFTDNTAVSSDLAGDEWSVAASFFDYDRDGLLDLYVVNYTEYPIDPPIRCWATTSRRDYCGPSAFAPTPDRLYRNLGDGRFADVSAATGLSRLLGPGLGVLAADFNGDDWADLYGANDGRANFLLLNQGDGTFQEDALFAGLAVNSLGQPEASMGIAFGDFDGDGDEDLFLTHLSEESNTLYVNDGGGLWRDATIATGLAVASRPMTGFGVAWLDVDNDGLLDLAVANGRVRLPSTVQGAGTARDLAQRNQLWQNRRGRFEEITDSAGEAFSLLEVSRGLVRGDVDNDGDSDLLLVNNDGPARLLLNRLGQEAPWIGVRVLERDRDAVGARVELQTASGSLVRRVHTDGSYASAVDPRVLFGLGGRAEPSQLRIRYADGAVEELPPPSPGGYTIVRRSVAPVARGGKTP